MKRASAAVVSAMFTFVTATGCDDASAPVDSPRVERTEAQELLADVDVVLEELRASPELTDPIPEREAQCLDSTCAPDDAPLSLTAEHDPVANGAPALYLWFINGNAVWAWGTTSSVIIGSGAPPAAISLQVMAGEATIASTMSTAAANPGTIYGVVADGTYVAGSFGSGGTATGAAGGTLAGTVGILAVAVVIAVGATIAIDCAMHDECIWTTVDNAGGWGVVLGTAPNPNSAPSGMVTVSCFDPTPRLTQCKNSSLKHVITNYYSWFGGSYWTCEDLWEEEADNDVDADEVAALNHCNALANQCVTDTNNACGGAQVGPKPLPAPDAPIPIE